jgi:thiol-disulfide isomerase/thioredoxin
MPINKIEFTQIEKTAKTNKTALDQLASDFGRVYVVSITRDGCPACQKHKPKIDKLAKSIAKKYGKKVVFIQIHVKYSPTDDKESLRSKDLFGHYFYPTTLILLRTRDRGAIELYRNVSPRVSELGKNIEAACKIAVMFEKEK